MDNLKRQPNKSLVTKKPEMHHRGIAEIDIARLEEKIDRQTVLMESILNILHMNQVKEEK